MAGNYPHLLIFLSFWIGSVNANEAMTPEELEAEEPSTPEISHVSPQLGNGA